MWSIDFLLHLNHRLKWTVMSRVYFIILVSYVPFFKLKTTSDGKDMKDSFAKTIQMKNEIRFLVGQQLSLLIFSLIPTTLWYIAIVHALW